MSASKAMEDAFRHEGEGLGGSLVRQTLFFPGGRQRLMIGSSPGLRHLRLQDVTAAA